MSGASRRVLLVGSATAAALLWTAAPSPAEGVRSLRSIRTATDPVEPVVAVLALGAQALVLWLAVVAVTTLAAELPGPAGRLGAAVARRCAPAVVRRGIGLALGVSVSVGTVSAPALATPVPAPTAVAASAAAGGSVLPLPDVPDLDWPGLRPATPPPATAPPAASSAALPPAAGPAPALPSPTPAAPDRSAAAVRPSAAASTRPVAPPSVVRGVPRSPVDDPAARTDAPSADVPDDGKDAPSLATAVVVRPGDTLWSLAASALCSAGQQPPTDAAVARAWPRWWEANREVIGDDPDLILPGTTLLPPPAPPSSRR